jgi:two-component system sensor histidine kinase HydH
MPLLHPGAAFGIIPFFTLPTRCRVNLNRKILLQVSAPAVLIGLALTAASLVSVWYVNRLQTNLAAILAENVSSIRAAQQMEISARRLRFHCFLALIDPDPAWREDVRKDQQAFEEWLDRGEAAAFTPPEQVQVRAIREWYARYRREFERTLGEGRGGKGDYRKLVEAHPIHHLTDLCEAYLRTNEGLMAETSAESERCTRQLHLALFLLALGGPLGGLLSGYGIARGLSRSLYRLSVRVQDAAEKLDRRLASVHLAPDGDLGHLDKQLQHVVARVGELVQDLQRQQDEVLRAQQLAAVGQLAASVAHEVRNPLTSIKMIVEAALREVRPKPLTATTLGVVHGEVQRLEKTVQNFLDFARPPGLQRHACDLRDVVASAVELIRVRARQQQVEIEVQAPDGPVAAEVDPGQLCTVLVNLFVNALDAMPGGGRLELRLSPCAEQGIRVRVTDTGAGISPAMMDRLFTPFASTKPTGSGLGLSISRRIVADHGGRIDGANRPEGGACFTLTLPATLGEDHRADTPGR